MNSTNINQLCDFAGGGSEALRWRVTDLCMAPRGGWRAESGASSSAQLALFPHWFSLYPVSALSVNRGCESHQATKAALRGNPEGSPVCVCVCVCVCSVMADSWQPLVCQAVLSTVLFRQEYWSGLPFPHPGYLLPPRDLPDPGIKPRSSVSPAGEFFNPLNHGGSPGGDKGTAGS